MLRSRLDTRSEAYRANAVEMEALWATVAAEMAAVPTIGGQRYVATLISYTNQYKVIKHPFTFKCIA